MKKILSLAAICVSLFCSAQQQELDSLLNELKNHPQEDTIRLNWLNAISYYYSDINPDKGLQAAEQAITIAKKLNDKAKLAESLLHKGMNADSKGEDSLALNLYIEVLQICKQQNLRSLSARTLHNIGIIYFNKSDYQKAMQNQEDALSIFSRLHDSLNMAHVLVSMGVIYQYQSDYPAALEYQQKALAIYSKSGFVKGIANSYTNMGIIYLHLDNYLKALDYHHKAFSLHEQSGNKIGMADALSNMGAAYNNMNDSANAMKCFQNELKISNAIGYKTGIAGSTSNIGILYYYYADYLKALPYLQKSILLMESLNDKTNQSLILRYIGNIYATAPEKTLLQLGIKPGNRYEAAIEYEQKALAIAKEIKALSNQEYAIVSLSDIYERQKNFKEALAFYKEADILGDSIINDSTHKEVTRLEMRYEFNKKEDSIKAVNDKKQALAAAEINRQKIIRNASIGTGSVVVIAAFASFIFYKRRKDADGKKKEAELKAEVTDTEMKALRAQMNPHFIFNSLNSIADYIDKNQTGTASDFTAKFAKLMRMVLENSEKKEIPIADDLKALELYMQLESLRLKNKFSYKIEVDDNIDKENTLVPPLILQPFVENSIWHGIAKKNEHGYINIHIRQEGEMLTCIVEDNGGGMKEPDILNEEKKSLGMRITKARIDIINKLKNVNATVAVANSAVGVRAEVRLPLELNF